MQMCYNMLRTVTVSQYCYVKVTITEAFILKTLKSLDSKFILTNATMQISLACKLDMRLCHAITNNNNPTYGNLCHASTNNITQLMATLIVYIQNKIN